MHDNCHTVVHNSVWSASYRAAFPVAAAHGR